ncbi:SH3-like domain-containing protein [Paraburkholderia silvatlantica]|uniref:Nitrile hydratase beta subunit n=1 Tax=Paraburkholderia silvatlantica TaxID=321895 RepID=A0A2V4TUZ5_9BURK|nr:SH3-like domain-containing protein [Paraburkholderia silvatlantica]PYE17279.1 nitrile hydratase beta subunit [Paraburkholderia silvatlantica]TDQ81119.1 nitrile hydratase beta subunit [Paraburkholderia silvatlantica]
MNSIHDVGGMHGMGPVAIDPDESVFKADWERQVFSTIGLYFAGGLCPIDEFRHAIEVMDPAEYLSTSYYVHWYHAMETLAINNGLLTKAEIDAKVRELQGAQ